jgi:trehalose 6-phosphate phosphatase
LPHRHAAASPEHNIPLPPFDIAVSAFLFDVDGTLLDIAPTPQSVRVPESLPHHLQQLSRLTGGATALVSGRPLHDLDQLFGVLPLTLVGGHGAELRLWRQGAAHDLSAPPLDDWVHQRCLGIAAGRDGVLVEDKGYSIALHYRLAPDQEQPIRKAAAAILADASAGSLAVLHGKAVIEIKRAGVDKGSGIRTLMAQAPFDGRRPIFVGDDITDEDAFAVMPEFGGVAVAVGYNAAGAAHRFETPAEVRRWIAQLCHADGSR